MTDIDISSEAVERLDAALASQIGDDISVIFNHESLFKRSRGMILALSAALTQSRAETAAAYERAANRVANCYIGTEHIEAAIRALATPDQSLSLAAVVAEAKADALGGPWEDEPDALTDAVHASHPVFTKDYKTYTDALELVSNRHGKGALVGLVNYLMAQNKDAEARGMRKAAEICADIAKEQEQKIQVGKNVPAHAVDVPQQMRWSAGKLQAEQLAEAILAALEVQPDPRDEVIARLVEALEDMVHRPNLTHHYHAATAAIAAAKEVMK